MGHVKVKTIIAVLLVVALFLAVAWLGAATPSILNRPDVRRAVAGLRKDTFQRGGANMQLEYVIIVRPSDNLFPLDWVAGTREDAVFPWDGQIIATIHTHLDRGFEQPSALDISEAKAHNAPVYVLSASEIWVALPDGDIQKIGGTK